MKNMPSDLGLKGSFYHSPQMIDKYKRNIEVIEDVIIETQLPFDEIILTEPGGMDTPASHAQALFAANIIGVWVWKVKSLRCIHIDVRFDPKSLRASVIVIVTYF